MVPLIISIINTVPLTPSNGIISCFRVCLYGIYSCISSTHLLGRLSILASKNHNAAFSKLTWFYFFADFRNDFQ